MGENDPEASQGIAINSPALSQRSLLRAVLPLIEPFNSSDRGSGLQLQDVVSLGRASCAAFSGSGLWTCQPQTC